MSRAYEGGWTWSWISWAVALMLLMGCGHAGPQTHRWSERPGEECPVIEVENRAFEDIVVRFPPRSERLGIVTGNTTEEFQSCGWLGLRSRFTFDAIGDRFSYPLEGSHSFQLGDRLLFVIQNNGRLSYVVGDGYGAGDDLDLEIHGLSWVVPLRMHEGIWEDVRGCLGVTDAPREFSDVAWAVADTIVATEDGRLLYGASVFEYWDRPVILIERPYWLHPTIISHEASHMLGTGEDEIGRCVMGLPGDLPGRVR